MIGGNFTERRATYKEVFRATLLFSRVSVIRKRPMTTALRGLGWMG